MKSEPETLSRFGTFTVTPGGKFLGTLLLQEQNFKLYLRDDKPFVLNLSRDTKITGILDDQTMVSILGSWDPTAPSLAGSPGRLLYFYELSLDYVILGSQEISEQEKNISSIRFVPEDWESLFGGSYPFGVVWDELEITNEVVQSSTPKRKPDLGKHQAIFYWTGNNRVLSCHTQIGIVSASHIIRMSGPDARGFRAESKVCVEIEFDQSITFDSATHAMFRVLMFFDYLVGRVQNFSRLAITVDGNDILTYDVHSCVARRHDRSTDGLGSGLGRSLIDGAKDPNRFGQVLASWISRESGWSEARSNLLSGWRNPHRYDSDRIIRSANVFDLIPSDSFPRNTDIPNNVQTILSNARREIDNLPEGPDKQRIKTNLGLVGKYTLRQRIAHRAEMVAGEFGDEIPEIDLVCKHAGDCRNRYVHGTRSRINLEDHPKTFMFLVDTLEFVFAVSDLIEAGWSVSDWQRLHVSSSHRFHSYLCSYRDDLEELKAVLDD